MANKRKGKTLSDSEVLSLINDSIKAGVKFTDTKLAKERQRVIDYFNGKLPAPVHGGNSRYVSTDVYDTVESMKSTLLEAFSGGSDIVQFSPKGEDDTEEAEVATAYTKYVIFEQNGGTSLFGTVIHDGLTARLGVAKASWSNRIEEIEETFDDKDEASLALMVQDEDVELTELAVDAKTNLMSGTLVRKIDKSQVSIESLPPEEFIVNPSIKSLEGEDITHRTEKSKSDLLVEGYDRSAVSQLSYSDASLEYDPERIARFDPVGGQQIGSSAERRQDANKLFVVYETYAHIDMDGSGVTRLWKIVHCGEVILEKEQVERHPFFTFVPLPVPHSFFGGNMAARVIPIQNAKTVLTRSILDHAVVANNPRYGVVKGALTNPRELIDNRIGGLVNVTRPDGIFPLPQAPLNPFVFQTIAMLDEDKEDTTGVSRLSQGLNKDAISNQNSQGMVEQLIGASMQRQKTIAREFAQQFLKPLFLEVYRLVVENEKKERIIEIAGKWVPVSPSSWRRMRDVSIDLRLGYGERDQMAEEYLLLNKILSEDPDIKPMYTPDKKYNLYRKVMEVKGHKNVSEFLADPKTVKPPEPDPMAAAELKLKQQEAALNERKQTLAEKEFDARVALEKQTHDFEQRFKTLEFALATHEQDRKDRETDNRIEVAQTEMELAAEQVRNSPPENDKATAIISPNG